MGWTDARTTGALEDLLERERTLILSGDFDGLARLSHEKEASFAGLAPEPRDAATLERIRRMADRNQHLLAAAARGLRAAQARIAALGRPDTSLRTYGRDGVPTDLGTRAPGLSKRA